MGHRNVAVRGFTAPDVPKVTIDVQEVQTNNSLLIADVSVAPGPSMLDPQTHSLKEDLTIAVTSAVTASKRTWPKGTLPDVFRVSLAVAGEVAEWPFDEYHSGPIVAELLSGSSNLRLAATVTLVDRILGWDIEVNRLDEADLVSPYQVDVMRAPSTVAFGVVILAVLIALAAFGAFVAVQTVRDRRQFQPPMTTWYAAMLFAVVPLRNALPDAPPFGSWIDITIVLWVIVVLVISMGLYISCWWRHLRPEPEQPAALE
ncbi:DUF4436 domain-containing protein [Mycobacterium montefiorense]|nr:DUF4436 domain-containing protein [Mycobacterium montefiorense]